jgi:hypothetical protein
MTNETKPLTREEAEMWRDGLCDANDFEPDSLPLRILAMLDTLATREADLAKVTAERDELQANYDEQIWASTVGGVCVGCGAMILREEMEEHMASCDRHPFAKLKAEHAKVTAYVSALQGMVPEVERIEAWISKLQASNAHLQAQANGADQRANAYLRERDEARAALEKAVGIALTLAGDSKALKMERDALRARCAQLAEALTAADGSHLHADGCTSQGEFEAVGDRCGECGADLKAARLCRAALAASDSGAWLAEHDAQARQSFFDRMKAAIEGDASAVNPALMACLADRDARTQAAALEEAAKAADAEAEPEEPMPAMPNEWSVEDVARASMRATRSSIVRRIRALASKPEGGGR